MSSPNETPEHEHISQLMATHIPSSPIYTLLLSSAQLLSATKGHVVFRLPLTSAHMNSKSGLHGAVSAAIVDWAGGMAIAAWDLRSRTGASVDIHVTYLSSAKEGDEVEIEAMAEKVGGNLAFTKVGIHKVEDGKRGRAVATGSHTKFVRTTA